MQYLKGTITINTAISVHKPPSGIVSKSAKALYHLNIRQTGTAIKYNPMQSVMPGAYDLFEKVAWHRLHTSSFYLAEHNSGVFSIPIFIETFIIIA